MFIWLSTQEVLFGSWQNVGRKPMQSWFVCHHRRHRRCCCCCRLWALLLTTCLVKQGSYFACTCSYILYSGPPKIISFWLISSIKQPYLYVYSYVNSSWSNKHSNFKLNRNMYLRFIHIPAKDEITLTFIL